MTSYYTKSEHGKGKFLYVELTKEQAAQMESTIVREDNGHRVQARRQLHTHNDTFHLTTDGAFDLYCQKRKETPKQVYILDTLKQIDMALEPLGFGL